MNKRGYLLALLAYVGLSILITWPVIAKLTTEYAGGRGDLWVHNWTFWWIKKALLNGLSPYFTPMLYYPNGVSLTTHSITWITAFFWIILQYVTSEIMAYNLIFIAVFSLNGFAMFLFARDWTQSTAAAMTAGIIFAFWPYTVSHYDHPNMMLVFFIPLALFWMRRAAQTQRWYAAVLAGLFLALTGINNWQMLLMALPLFISYSAYLLWRKQSEWQPRLRDKRQLGR